MANKSEELRRVTTRLLKLSCSRTYYGDANDKAIYPYQVFITDSHNKDQFPRNDDIIIVDVWDKCETWTEAERLADLIEDNLDMKNEPDVTILPTYLLIDRRPVKDQDKTLKHIQLKFLIKNYYIGE